MATRRVFLHYLTGSVTTLALQPLFEINSAVAAEHPVERFLSAASTLAKQGNRSLRLLLPRGSDANVNPIVDAFRDATGVSVDFVFTGVDEINTRILADAFIGSSSFDIALPATFGIPDLVEAGAIAPLDEFERKYGYRGAEDNSLYRTGDSFLGSTYGFQTDGDAYVMFYRADMLSDTAEAKTYEDKFGEPLQAPQTWEQCDRMMAFFHRPSENQFGGALFRNINYIAWEWWVRLHANGSWPVADDFSALINSDHGVAALEAMIRASENLYPSAFSNGLVANWKAYAEGDIFANIGWGGSQKYFNQPNSKIRNKLQFGLTPGGNANGKVVRIPYFNWGWNYTVSKSSKSPELAYLFARYATSSDISAKAIRNANGFFDPFRPEHYQDEIIRSTYSPGFLDIHRQSMENCIPDFYVRAQGEYFDALRENLSRALTGRKTAKESLDLAAKQWEHITDRVGRDGQIAQWKSLKSKYPPAVLNFLSGA